jgi:hypothetical protein
MKYARVAGFAGSKCAGRAPNPPIVAALAVDTSAPPATAHAVTSSEMVLPLSRLTGR